MGLLAAAVGLRGQYAAMLAEHCRRQLATVPDEQAEALLQQAARLAEPGIPVLVEAFASDRQSVATAGRRVLLDEVARWKSLRARQSSPKLATLAEALADHAGGLGPDAQTDAANLATQILLWPLDDAAVDRGRVIASCEKVLRLTRGGNRPSRRTQVSRAPGHAGPGDDFAAAGPAAAAGPKMADGENPLTTGIPLPGLAKLPGGGLPDEPPPAAEASADNAERSPVADGRARRPRGLDGPTLEQPRRLLAEPENARSILNARVPSPSGEAAKPDSLRRSAFLEDGGSGAGHSAAEGTASSAWDEGETMAIMRRLHSTDGSVAAAARRELARRGFTPVHLEIARQLVDPDPAVRVRLARQLPHLGSIDPAPWLLRLSEDENAEVRRVAMALLATTGDPALVRRIERMAREDPDPAIQRQAEQIARRRTAPGR